MDGACILEFDGYRKPLPGEFPEFDIIAEFPDAHQAEILEGLTRRPKTINPKFFYDDRGSRLFDQITKLSEYYPTRTEVGILKENATAIADCAGCGSLLIEPGAGSCTKVRYLLDELKPAVYLPQDISAEFLKRASSELRGQYPWLEIKPLAGDFSAGIELPDHLPCARKIVFYPGSTIGNFDPPKALEFLRDIRRLVGASGGLIIGVDLQKDPAILNAAYNDAAGITAEFNRNVLYHVNRLLNADITPELFSHRAFYNADKHRVEMHLVSDQTQKARCQGTDLQFTIEFLEGESIHTESSYKYTPESFADLAEQASFTLRELWLDKDAWFGVFYME